MRILGHKKFEEVGLLQA